MPDYEYPGVHVDEAGGGRPIDGLPTDDDLPAWAEAPWFLRIALIGGLILACLGIVLAVQGAVIVELILLRPALTWFLALIVPIILWIMRAWVERRRRKAGRPPLRITKLIMGIAVINVAELIAAHVGIIALVASLATGPPLSSLLFAVGTNLLLGGTLILFAMRALRDILLLAQASRDRSPNSTTTRAGA